MKTVEYKRIEKPGTVPICTMRFNRDATVVLDFGKEQGGKLKLPADFLGDAIEHYLNYIIEKGIQYAAEEGLLPKNNK